MGGLSRETTKVHSEDTFERLRDSIVHHDSQIDRLRKKREKYLEAASGTLYAHNRREDSSQQEMINLMRQAAESMTLSMAANRPRFLVNASAVKNTAFANHFEQALNVYATRMHMEETLQECVRNAFYHIGIAKVSFGNAPNVIVESDEWMSPGEPYCGCVSPNHFCYDTDATDFRHCAFTADRYRVRFNDLVEDQRFDSKVRNEIKKRGPDVMRNGEEEWGKPLNAGFGTASQFEEFVYLTDVFLPKDGMIYTFPCDGQFRLTSTKPIYDQEWNGSETGPYKFLNLGPIPDKTTPSSPASNLLLLHELVNSLYRKLSRQASQQKQILGGRMGHDDDVKSAQEAQDGDVVLFSDPSSFEMLRFFGPDQSLFAFALNAIQQFDTQGGGVKHQLGVGQSADTLGQEQMVSQRSAGYQASYGERYNKFVSDIAVELSRLLFEDQVTELKMTRNVTGTDISYDAPWLSASSEGGRQGDFDDYGITIDPYSMGYRSPQDRLAELSAALHEAVSLGPVLQEQGKVIDLDYYLQQKARLTDMPDLTLLIKDAPPPPDQQREQQAARQQQGSDPNKGVYTHRSVSNNDTGNDQIQQMMAAGQPGAVDG